MKATRVDVKLFAAKGSHVEGEKVLLDPFGQCGAQTEASASRGGTCATPKLSATAGWHTDFPTTLIPATNSG